MGHSPPRAPHHETPSETCEAPNSETRGVPSRIRQIPNPRSCGDQIQKQRAPNPGTVGPEPRNMWGPESYDSGPHTVVDVHVFAGHVGHASPPSRRTQWFKTAETSSRTGSGIKDAAPMPDDQSEELRRPRGYAARGWCLSCRVRASANRRRRPHARPPGRGHARAGRC